MNQRAIELHDEALKLMPEGASHDEVDCPVCIEKAAREGGSTEENPTESSPREAAQQEGQMSGTTDSLSTETHEALLQKAVQDATTQLQGEVASLTEQVESLTAERDAAASKASGLEGEIARLNDELDTAQVALKSATDEAESLKTELAQRDEEARISEIAAERAKQVRNLGLFSDEVIEERASRWAALSDDDWSERVDEWKGIKQVKTDTPASQQEQASAITGSSEGDEASEKTSGRRKILGLA